MSRRRFIHDPECPTVQVPRRGRPPRCDCRKRQRARQRNRAVTGGMEWNDFASGKTPLGDGNYITHARVPY